MSVLNVAVSFDMRTDGFEETRVCPMCLIKSAGSVPGGPERYCGMVPGLMDDEALAAQADDVRSRDVRAGRVYRVEVPQRLPVVSRSRAEALVDSLRLALLRGCRFELTVIDLDTSRSPATVQGIRTLTEASVVLPLSLEQAADLGLSPGAYEVFGYLRSSTDGQVVELPAVQTLTVPVRWLHSLESVPSLNHRDITGHLF